MIYSGRGTFEVFAFHYAKDYFVFLLHYYLRAPPQLALTLKCYLQVNDSIILI